VSSSFTVGGAAHALLEVGDALITDPDFIVSPRGKLTHELRNVTVTVTDPSDVTMMGIGRNWNSKIAVAEFLQLCGGFSDPKAMVAIAPTFAEFLGDNERFHGAYGERTDLAMRELSERLQEEPDTRQGVVTVWENARDQSGKVHKDMPCTTYMNFTVRENTLLMTTHMRSNDVWRGWCYDAFQFMQLGWTLANFLGVRMGPYTHMVDSLHMYVEDIEKFYELDPEDAWLERHGLVGLDVEDCGAWKEVQEIARDIFYDPNPRGENDTEKWMIDTGVGKVVHDAVSR
jgi:thymidylate synthase